jgi:hypothetical protein
MKKGEIKLTQPMILVVASTIAVIMLISAISLPIIFGNEQQPPSIPGKTTPITENNETQPVPTEGNKTNDDSSNKPMPTATKVLYVIPFWGWKGSNLPKDFKVMRWHDNSCDIASDPNFVEIYSVEINNGVSPYHFYFINKSDEIVDFEISSANTLVHFSSPVKVLRNTYTQVVISFQSPLGKSEWVDHIKYLDKKLCDET